MSRYVVLEGIDGCGKSLQAERLCRWLEAAGRPTLHVREPGSTPVGEALRRLLLDPGTGPLEPLSEALLFCAARAQLLSGAVRPALAAGRVVVAERCFLSTLVYQGLAPEPEHRVPLGLLRDLTREMHDGLWPDAIFLLDVAPEVGAARSGDDRIEGRSTGYRTRVRDGFRRLAAEDPRIEVVDGNAAPEAVHAGLQERVARLLAS